MRTFKLRLGVVVVLVLLGMCSCSKKGETKSEGVSSEPAQASFVVESTMSMVPLPIVLPSSQQIGTPLNIHNIPHLEAISNHARPPFTTPKNVTNVALNKPVSSSTIEPFFGELSVITDGIKETDEDNQVELDILTQHVTIDLGLEYEIYAILFWHRFLYKNLVYKDVIVQVSNDPDFIAGVTTLFNNDIDGSSGLGPGKHMHYIESHQGKLIDAKGVTSRYVRLYSNGSNAGDANHYLEVEVYGRNPK